MGGIFENFVSESSVCENETGSDKNYCVKGHRCCTEFGLQGVLPLTDETDLHKIVLVECVGDTCYQSIPLHRVCLMSNFVSGNVTVGIVDKIATGAVEMLHGNDLAGGQDEICPMLCEKHVASGETCNVS